jgi:hypothetical protein
MTRLNAIKTMLPVLASLFLGYPSAAQSPTQPVGCGITKALATYDASAQTYLDTGPVVKIIMFNGDDKPPYSLCTVPELKKADVFMNGMIARVLDAHHPMAEQEGAIGQIHEAQKEIRAEIKRQTESHD